MRSMSASARAQLAADAAGVDHDDAVGEGEDLLELVGDQQHGDASVGGGAQALADELDRPDVEPAARLGGDEHGRLGGELAGEHDALLVAARQRRERGVRPDAVDAELGDQLLGAPPPLAAVDAGQRPAAAEVVEREVLGDAQPEHAPGIVAVLGDQPDAGGGHRPGPAGRHGDAVDLDACRRRGRARLPSTSASSAWPLPSTPATPTISPAWTSSERRSSTARVRARVATASVIRSVGGPAAGRRGDRVRPSDVGCLDDPEGQRLVAQRHRPPDHRLGQRAGVGVVRRHRVDDATAAQDRDDVGGVEDLVELVADEGDRLALGRDGDTQHGEQLLGLLRGEHRRRLVEDDDVGVAAQALDDLDALAHPGGEVADDGVGIEAEPVALADLADEVARRLPVEPAALAERDVLPHEELVDEAEVLVHHADAERGRRLRVGDRAARCRRSRSRRCRA